MWYHYYYQHAQLYIGTHGKARRKQKPARTMNTTMHASTLPLRNYLPDDNIGTRKEEAGKESPCEIEGIHAIPFDELYAYTTAHALSVHLISYTVHYAAEIGAQGLDIEDSLLRKEVFQQINELSSDTVANEMMDKTIPWQPEPIRYQVVQIKRSKKSYQYVPAY